MTDYFDHYSISIHPDIICAIDAEREHQRRLWGDTHDRSHSNSNFAEYIDGYALRAGTQPERAAEFFVKIAALAIAALEAHTGTTPLRGRDYE